MSMATGGPRLGPKADLNVTPLIDIVLVLLIIFMVLTPMVQRAYDLNIPEKAQIDQPVPQTQDQLIVTIQADGRLMLNREEIGVAALKTRLEDALRNRTQKIVFFNADNSVIYQQAVTAMDAIRAAGGTVGLVTTDL